MKIEIALLKFLRAAGDLLTPEPQLRDDVRLAVSPVPTGTEISSALNRLEDRRWAISLRDGVIGTIKWQITDEGRAMLAQRNL